MGRLSAAALAWLLLAGAAAPNTTRRTPVVLAVERVSRAVVAVSVDVMVSYQNPFDWFFRDFSGPTRQKETASQGSGVVIDGSGLVLTNYHVIQVGGDIRVELTDGRRFAAKVVGSAPDHDLAVLELASAAAVPHIPM